MASDVWVIEIHANNRMRRKEGVFFLVFLPGAQPGAPLQAKPQDFIVLTNRTNWNLAFESVPPGLVDFAVTIKGGLAAGPFPIPPNHSKIQYRCKNPEQVHTIEIQ
jgi:hypothetical protein